VVSVDQWGDIVEQLAGDCATVTTVIESSKVDPHDYEPTTGDAAKFTDAELVVVNGMDYDPWADKIVATLNPKPPVVDAGKVAGLTDGENPHVWYGPDYVFEFATAVTAELSRLSPKAAEYFTAQAEAWNTSMQPYRDEIASIKASYSGSTYAATESVFDYMAVALGLKDVTPTGFAAAAANETDPSPGDVAEFDELLKAQGAEVLIYNIQTEGAIPEQIRATAEQAEVPVVDVTESVAPNASSFEQWQVDQLKALSSALKTTG
jgi:zinc/manganese transport system substrate-binding protein